MRKEVPHSMRLSRGLWPKGHHLEGKEGREVMEIEEGSLEITGLDEVAQ